MRRLVAALFGLFLLATTAASEPARRVSVGELAANPTVYFDQRLIVTGVVHLGAWGPNLCALPSQPKRECTDLDDINLPFGTYDWRYHKAVLEVVGYFTHTCYPRKQPQSDGTVVEVVCLDRGGNGWITAESVRVVGAIAGCDDEICSRGEEVAEIRLTSPEAAGTDAFAGRLIEALRSGQLAPVLDLVTPSQRTWLRWKAEVEPAYVRKRINASWASAPLSIAEPGVGYRLVHVDDGIPPTQQKLCFCKDGNCSRIWQHAGKTPTALQRLPIDCFTVWRGPKGWVVVY